MKYAADFRYIAREALRGKWLIAVVVGLVASLLGGAEQMARSSSWTSRIRPMRSLRWPWC